MNELLTLDDYEIAAREKLPHAVYEFIAGGAADEHTLRWNREAFARIRLRPRILEDVDDIDTRVTLFGHTYEHPIFLAPVAYQRTMHNDGEVGSARGARGAGFVVSTASNCPIEEIASAATGPLWLQLYLQNDRELSRDLVQRAEAVGCTAFALTVDTPLLGTRNRQQRAGFKVPPELPTPQDANERGPITWKDFAWLRGITSLPILLKGIFTGDDASRAIDHGAAGIIVSNHGARNLDTVPATIDALPEVAAAVNARVPILFDGGIRRGTDVVKAIALGANAILIGRPYAYGLAVDGANGVAHVIDILREELTAAMALLGKRTLAMLDRSVIW